MKNDDEIINLAENELLVNEIKDVFISNPKNGIDKYPEYFH